MPQGILTCEMCGTEKAMQASRLKRRGRTQATRFCSRACWAKSRERGGSITKSGYRMLQARAIRKYEHRFVMEQMLGRPLRPGETVHHLDGDRLNNAPANLELWDCRQPKGQRVQDKIDWAILYLAERGYQVIAPLPLTAVNSELPEGARKCL